MTLRKRGKHGHTKRDKRALPLKWAAKRRWKWPLKRSWWLWINREEKTHFNCSLNYLCNHFDHVTALPMQLLIVARVLFVTHTKTAAWFTPSFLLSALFWHRWKFILLLPLANDYHTTIWFRILKRSANLVDFINKFWHIKLAKQSFSRYTRKLESRKKINLT